MVIQNIFVPLLKENNNMKKLAIVSYLKKHGLEKAVKTFNLKTREYDNKVLLKYYF